MVTLSQKERQKQEELQWFLTAQGLCPEFPSTHFCQPPSPRPDILFEKQQLGIEITRYIRGQGQSGSEERRRESLCEEVLRIAQRRFEKTSSEILAVSVFWTTTECLSRGVQNWLADQIVEIVKRLLIESAATDIYWRPNLRNRKEIQLAGYFLDVSVWRRSKDKPASWSCGGGTTLGNYQVYLQQTLDHKAGRIAEYKNWCRTIWLLIVAEGRGGSSIFSPDEDFESATFQTTFDRVFLLDVLRNAVRELCLGVQASDEDVSFVQRN